MSDRSVAVPTLVSIVLCDQVIDDKITNKKSAIGLFNMVLVQSLPTAIQQVAVLATLTEITSRVRIELRLVRDADNSVLFSTTGPVPMEQPNPLAMVDLVFSMHGLRVSEPGQYAFELLSGGELLGRRRFQVVQRTAQADPGTSSAPDPPAA